MSGTFKPACRVACRWWPWTHDPPGLWPYCRGRRGWGLQSRTPL